MQPALRYAPLTLFLVALFATTACGDDSSPPAGPVHFQRVTGSVSIPSEGIEEAPLSLPPDSTLFFGPGNIDEPEPLLDMTVETGDRLIYLSLILLKVSKPGELVIDTTPAAADPRARLVVLIGEGCDRGMGDLLFGDCRWYTSDFFSAGCTAVLSTVTRERIAGTIDCRTLGVNCPLGTGARTETGACADGERYEALNDLKASFELTEPLTLEQIEARDLPPGEETAGPR